MRYKRNEAFRFQFQTPLDARLKYFDPISEKEQLASISLIDISPNGLKFISKDNLCYSEDVWMEVVWKLNNEWIRMPGTIVWKSKMGISYMYGVKGIEDQTLQNEIIQALKTYAKRALKQ